MKIPFTFFALFATQIIPLKAGINGRKNLLVRGSLRPQLKFWRNPFGSSKGMIARDVFKEFYRKYQLRQN